MRIPAIIMLSIALPAHAADGEITDAAALSAAKSLIETSGYSCPRVIGAWAFGTDEYGNQIRVVCPGGETISGLRYRVSFNPTTKNFKVRVGW